MLKNVRVAVFVSGGGTNLEALLKAQEAGAIPHGEIVLVCATHPFRLRLDPCCQPWRAGNRRFPGGADPGEL